MDCDTCGCIRNFNDNTEFCGKMIRNGNSITTVGCDTECPECDKCDYEIKNNKKDNIEKIIIMMKMMTVN